MNEEELRRGFSAYSAEQKDLRDFLSAEKWVSQHEFDKRFGRPGTGPRVARSFEPHTFIPPLSAVGSCLYLWILQDLLMSLGEVEAKDVDGVVYYRLVEKEGV